jgi:hypothetical protein
VSFSDVDPEPLHEFTFFVDAETYMSYGGELDATEQDLHSHQSAGNCAGVEGVRPAYSPA